MGYKREQIAALAIAVLMWLLLVSFVLLMAAEILDYFHVGFAHAALSLLYMHGGSAALFWYMGLVLASPFIFVGIAFLTRDGIFSEFKALSTIGKAKRMSKWVLVALGLVIILLLTMHAGDFNQ